jgi:hypothetical protein
MDRGGDHGLLGNQTGLYQQGRLQVRVAAPFPSRAPLRLTATLPHITRSTGRKSLTGTLRAILSAVS